MRRRDVLKGITLTPLTITVGGLTFSANVSAFSEYPFGGEVLWAGITYLSHSEGRLEKSRASLTQKTQLGSANQVLTRLLQGAGDIKEKVGLVIGSENLEYAEGVRAGMTLALANELVAEDSVSKVDGSRVFNCLLVGYAFIYDIQSKEIQYSFPVRVQYTVGLDRPDARAQDVFNMMLNVDAEQAALDANSLQSYLVARLKKLNVSIPSQNRWRYRVATPGTAERVASDTAQMGVNESEFLDWMGFALTDAFSSKLNVPVSPYRDSRATGVDMLIQFPSGSETLALEIPPSDYEIRPVIRGWGVKEKTDPQSSVVTMTILAGLSLEIVDVFNPADPQVLFSQRFRVQSDYLQSDSVRYDPMLKLLSMYGRLFEEISEAIGGSGPVKERLFSGQTIRLSDEETVSCSLVGDSKVFESEAENVKKNLPF